ncbi:DUF2690 domain-containing protein [Streptomyces sp. NPDC020096]
MKYSAAAAAGADDPLMRRTRQSGHMRRSSATGLGNTPSSAARSDPMSRTVMAATRIPDLMTLFTALRGLMTTSWRPIPNEMPDSARRLTEELRAIKDSSGLSLSQMAAKTHYSKASWERWLNGKRLITPHALKSLASCVDCDEPALLALHEAASYESREPAAVVAEKQAADPVGEQGSSPEQGETPPDHGSRPPGDAAGQSPARRLGRSGRMLIVAVVAVVAMLVGCGVWLMVTRDPGDRGSAVSAQPVAAKATASPPPCQGIGCAGKDPQSTGCVLDAQPPVTANDGKVILYVHYSPRCRAARSGITNGAKGDTATITNGTGGQKTALIHWGYDNYSMMVDASDPKTVLQVCGEQPAGRACTSLVANPAHYRWPKT